MLLELVPVNPNSQNILPFDNIRLESPNLFNQLFECSVSLNLDRLLSHYFHLALDEGKYRDELIFIQATIPISVKFAHELLERKDTRILAEVLLMGLE